MPTLLIRFLLRLGVICSVLALVWFHPRPAWACSCAMPSPPALAFAQVDAVFSGQVVRIADQQQSVFHQLGRWLGFSVGYANYGYQVTFNVADSWKGATTTTVQVVTGYGGGDCGYSFQVGASYLLYVYANQDSTLDASICSRTTTLAQAGADLTYLASQPTLPLTTVFDPTPFICLGSLLLVGLLGFGAVFLVWRRFRRSAQPLA